MLKRITFTGADDNTDIDAMLRLSEQHNFIEWGILLPPVGRKRFPSVDWLRRLIGAQVLSPSIVMLSGHICPPWTAAVINDTDVTRLIGSAFTRIQINTHAEDYSWTPGYIDRLNTDMERQYILQLDGRSGSAAFTYAVEAGFVEHDEDVITGLHDLSHGAGIAPDTWPKGEHQWIGYAGGLGPHNLAEQLPKIVDAAGASDFWIDMETHVRTDGRFDLDKVRRCIEIAQPYLPKQ